MSTYIVKQPDGKFAIFSTFIDNFVAVAMTREQAVIEISRGAIELARHNAIIALDRADRDEDFRTGEKGDGTARWKNALSKIENIHGEDEAQRMSRFALDSANAIDPTPTETAEKSANTQGELR